MLAIVLALAAALGYGASDFAAGLVSRGVSVIPVTLIGAAVSVVTVAVALPFAASPGPRMAAVAWGAGAGLGGTLGAFALYLGFRHAAFSVAGPLSAVGSAGFSVLAGLLYGERPTGLALAGIVLALPAIVGVSVSAGDGASGAAGASGSSGASEGASGASGPSGASAASEEAGGRAGAARGVMLGLAAGACFALLFIGLDRAGPGSGLWPVAAATVSELVAAFAVAVVAGLSAGLSAGRAAAGAGGSAVMDGAAGAGGMAVTGGAAGAGGTAATDGSEGLGRGFRLPDARARLLAVVAGVSGTTGTIMFFFATHQGYLAVTAVLTALYPAVTIVLARTMLGERLTALRLAGLALAGVCVSLIAVGGAG